MPRRKVSRKRTMRTRKSKSSTTKKKKTRTKQVTRSLSKKSVTTSSDRAHFDVRVNPFSTATPQPKILDGLFTSSLSRRLQNVEEIANVQGTLEGRLPSNEMWVVFSPTFGIPVTVFNTLIGRDRRGAIPSHPQYIGCNNQTALLQNCANGNQNLVVWPPEVNTTYEVVNKSGFSNWRIVSSGLRLELANTDEENDGWFEAFRFNWNQNPDHLAITGLAGTRVGEQLGVGVSPNILGYLQGVSLTEQPGYTTGLLKDINKLEFRLHPQSSTHDPCVLKSKNDYTNGLDMIHSADLGAIIPQNGNLLSNEIINQYVDNNMDWICLKLHTRNAVGTGVGSRLVCSVIQNIEFTVNPVSDLATFQTTNKRNSEQAGLDDNINNDQMVADTRRYRG